MLFEFWAGEKMKNPRRSIGSLQTLGIQTGVIMVCSKSYVVRMSVVLRAPSQLEYPS
jgi:hypothetical protein